METEETNTGALDTILETSEAFDAFSRNSSTGLSLVQVSAPWCPRCPEVSTAISEARKRYAFDCAHAPAETAHELLQRFEIKRLPALIVTYCDQTGHLPQSSVNGETNPKKSEEKSTIITTMQAVTPTQLSTFLEVHASPIKPTLVLDCDF